MGVERLSRAVSRSPSRSPSRGPGDGAGNYTFTNSEASALVARFTTSPSDTRKAQIDTLVGALKSAGIWSKLDALYILAAHDAQAARRNWIADQYNLTAVSSPTFTANRGYAGDGASSYLDTGLIPSTFGGLYALNNASFGGWSLTSRAGSTSNLMGTSSGANVSPFAILQTRFTDDNLYGGINDAGAAAGVSNTQTNGLFAVDRSASGSFQNYLAGAALGTARAVASVSLPTNSIALLARKTNTGGNRYTTDQIAMAFVGQSLGALQSSLKSAVEAYLSAVGAV